jgi:hypothetical protein
MALLNNEHVNIDNLPPILALDVAGQPRRWISYKDSCYYAAKGLVAWSMGEQDVTLFGGKSRMTGEQSTLTMNTIIAIRGHINAKAIAHHRVPLTNKALFRRDRNVCAYCGDQSTHTRLTRDHIHPSSKGGIDKWTNVVTACGSCNKRKSDLTLEQANMQLMYVPYEPNRAEYLILMNKKILTDQMDFLLKQVPKHSRLHLD